MMSGVYEANVDTIKAHFLPDANFSVSLEQPLRELLYGVEEAL